ncbi:UDP-N-acetylmuramoyl-tripeptide--D-alanyl-D-alanine ligase [Acidaminobacter sp. JC074]|uniref:UDP-N-acetylmuramoyl-tripeptide--D-alanyl-D- alanine ligase n=1 Tax=Acidaminobacter sp. JC074 TaxID=2530199 RepID=UPI001F0F8AE3|nr:UDP-N-acetylmuramoyl-tripeptide--D-alanyl-D-alanine ligase [Acidaminobacter sp. JC074]
MIEINLNEMLKITEGVLINPSVNILFNRIEIDSRKVDPKAYFMPILGEVHDGHKFILNAFEAGVQIAFCERAYYYANQEALKDLTLILVDNTTKTLHRISKYILEKTGVQTIGITGSVGKTSTKEFVYHVLKNKYSVHKNKGNFNNHIGMPLTIFDLTMEHELAVLEMGMNHFKEIEVLAEIARPHVAVVTNIGTSHIGILGSRENIFQAKMEITSYLRDEDTLIIHEEDNFLKRIGSTSFKTLRIGSDMTISRVLMKEDGCFTYDFNYKGCHPVELNVLGKHNIINSALAIAVGIEMGVEVSDACKLVSDFVETNKRLEILQGKKGSSIISDCYNASQESMISAIDVLNNYEGKTIAILGDVLELGDFSKISHEAVGEYLAAHPMDMLMTFGKDSEYIKLKAESLGYDHAYHFSDIDALYEFIDKHLDSSTILVKGSFGMGMSRIVDFLGGKHENNLS